MPNAAHKPLYSIKAQKSQRDLKCCVYARVVGAKRKIENKLAAKVGIDRLRNNIDDPVSACIHLATCYHGA